MTTELSLYLLICVTTILSPGPGVVMTVTSSLKHGIRSSWASATGNAFGVLIMSLISASGLGALLTASPKAFIALQVIGAGYLLWLGYKNWNDTHFDLLHAANKAHSRTMRWELFRDSALVQTTNPMLILFLLSLFPQFIVKESPFWPQAFALLLIFTLLCFLIHIGYALVATYARQWLSGKTASIIVAKVSAVLFALLGLAVLGKLVGEWLF